MSVWEYRCTIVPIAGLRLLEPLNSQILPQLDSLELWSGQSVSDLLRQLPSGSKQSKGWSQDLTILAFGEACRIEIYAKEEVVLDVQMILDLRFAFVEVLQILLAACQQNQWVLIDDEARLLPAEFDRVVESIQASPAAEVVANPKGFLERHGRTWTPPSGLS